MHRPVLAFVLALSAGAAVAEQYATVEELLNQAKACVADKANCMTTVRLGRLGLDLRLRAGANWMAETKDVDKVPTDILRRSDDAGTTTIVFNSMFAPDLSCGLWADYMTTEANAERVAQPLVKPEGWSDSVIDLAGGVSTLTCLDFRGGIITAQFANPARDRPESHLKELRIALEAVGLAIEASPPVEPPAN